MEPIETSNSDAKYAALHAKTADEGWARLRLVLLMVSTLLCNHKTAHEGWDPYRRVILVVKSLF